METKNDGKLSIKEITSLKLNDFPIRHKLIALLFLISIFPSLLLSLLTGFTVERTIEKQVTANTHQLIGQVNKTLESYLNNMQNISYLISYHSGIDSFILQKDMEESNTYEIGEFLRSLTTLYPEVAGILVANSNGAYISNELYMRDSQNLTDESWYKEAAENEGIFKILGHPKDRDVTSHVQYKDDEVVSVVRAIVDPETQEVSGVVLIDLKLRVIAEATKDARLGKTGYLMVMDEDGGAIYSPAKSSTESFPMKWFTDGQDGTFVREIGDTQTQFIYRKSPFTNWTTIGVFPKGEAVSEVREILFYVISFVFFVILFGVTASYYLARTLSRPIHQLMISMRKAEEGDLEVRYQDPRKDELGMLGRSFNKMISQVSNLLILTEKQEKQKREAEVRSLQEHIKPHFLYNTLDTINWMARRHGAQDVSDVVGALSRLFRIGLNQGRDIIPLKEEIQHIQSYLKIQKARYKDKLNYTLEVDPSVEEIPILKLVLQPIVENAIYHGIKERRGPGHILIQAEKRQGDLAILVKDDGKGMSEVQLTELNRNLEHVVDQEEESKEGYGMRNVQTRIIYTYGPHYGLNVESQEGKGTCVTILLPIGFKRGEES